MGDADGNEIGNEGATALGDLTHLKTLWFGIVRVNTDRNKEIQDETALRLAARLGNIRDHDLRKQSNYVRLRECIGLVQDHIEAVASAS